MTMRPAIVFALLLASLCVAAIVGVVLTAAQPSDYHFRHLVVDDAIYYVQPAKNLLAGNGYSFDGVHRTNGVQPLWALVVVALTALLSDPGAVVRAMVLLGGLLWIAGAVQAYRLLARLHPFAGFVGGAVLLMAGMDGRMSTRGMEAGLHCFLLVQTLCMAHGAARAELDDPARPRRLRWLGVTAAMLSLTRVEYGLFAALLGVWLLWTGRANDGLKGGLRRALPYALPLAAIGGCWLLFSRVYFGEWTPISGTVKAFVSAREQDPLLARLGMVGKEAFNRVATAPFVVLFVLLCRMLGRLVGDGEVRAWMLGAAAPLLLGVGALWRRFAAPSPLRTIGIAAALAAFLAVHALLMAMLLAPYIGYCGWYMTGETVAISLLVGALCGALRGWWRLAAAPVLVMLALGYWGRMPDWYRFPEGFVTAPFVDLGRWMNERLPAGATIGCFASGYIAVEADRHRVINLDGLINDGRYLRDYVMQGKVPEYFRDERIGYFADNLPAAKWKPYVTHAVHELPAELRPIWCRPSAQGTVMAVFATADGDPALPIAVPHPLAATMVDALILEQRAALRRKALARLSADQVVAFAELLESGDVAFVAIPKAELADAVDARGFEVMTNCSATFDGRVQLRAIELPVLPVRAGEPFAVTTYWQALPAVAQGAAFELCLQVGEQQLRSAPAYGTLPLADWPDGALLAHTFVARAPTDGGERIEGRAFVVDAASSRELPAEGDAGSASFSVELDER